MGLLGAILTNNAVLPRCEDIIKPDDFSEPIHKQIYEVALGLFQANVTADAITIRPFLKDADLGGVTVREYTARIASNATSVSNAESYAREIRDASVLRQLIGLADDTIRECTARKPGQSVSDLISDIGERAEAMRPAEQGKKKVRRFKEVLAATVDKMARAYQNDGRITGVTTGLKDFDDKIGGFQPGDFIIVGARPGMGKTALAQRIVLNAGINCAAAAADERWDQAGRVIMFSIEMVGEELGIRIIAEKAGFSPSRVRRNTISEDEFKDAVYQAKIYNDLPIVIDESSHISLAQISGKVRMWQRSNPTEPIRAIAIDYLQIMGGGPSKGRDFNRVQELTAITTGLKALAKEIGCPVIALAQLSRAVEQRDDKRPQLSDLRESGSIEQDADVVVFLHREEYYLGRHKPQEGTDEFYRWETKMQAVHNRAELIVAKNRHGAVGIVEVGFDTALMRFTDSFDELPETLDDKTRGAVGRVKKKAPPKLSPKAILLWGVIKNQTAASPLDPLLKPRVEWKGSRLIDGLRVKELYAADIDVPLENFTRADWNTPWQELAAHEMVRNAVVGDARYIYANPEKL